MHSIIWLMQLQVDLFLKRNKSNIACVIARKKIRAIFNITFEVFKKLCIGKLTFLYFENGKGKLIYGL